MVFTDENERNRLFPVSGERIFMAHAGISPLPLPAVEGMEEFLRQSSRNHQESGVIPQRIEEARSAAAELLGGGAHEIALLGPTSLGLNIVADGLPWAAGDEVVFYYDDYPANVYPWTKLESRGVVPVALRPDFPGVVTWESIEERLSARTRLVAVASCHFLSGYRPDIDRIGKELAQRGVLFCVDGIQSLGAFPLSVKHVDFLSADSHKWLLGPMGAGVLYVKESLFPTLTPPLRGAWNVVSPDFVAQEKIRFYDTARRYEPGALNIPGILGMLGSLRMILDAGAQSIAKRILRNRESLVGLVRPHGYRLYGEEASNPASDGGSFQSGIITLVHDSVDAAETFRRLEKEGISVSLRRDRKGRHLLRISPHFYNTVLEVERVAEILADSVT